MIVIQWAVTIFMWMIASAFVVSDFLCLLALFHNWKDREFVLVIGVVIVLFALFAAVAVYTALSIGRCL